MERPPDTIAWLAATLDGDPAARERLFGRCLPRVRQIVALRLGVRADQLPAHAEDIVQDALLGAFQALPRFRMQSVGAFYAWLAKIAENRLRNEVRRRRLRGEVPRPQFAGELDLAETVFPSRDRTPSSQAALNERTIHVEAAILTLPGLYRRCIELHDIAGMDCREVARELGRTEASVRKIHQRAREMLLLRLAP